MFAGGGGGGGLGALEPHSQPPTPPPSGLKRQAARKGLGGARNAGLSVPPLTFPQNHPKDTLIALRCVSWGKEFSENFRSWPLGGPSSSQRTVFI